VAAGGVYVTPSLADRVVLWQLGGGEAHGALTERERDVLRRIVAGERLTDIASALGLSVKTVSTHKTHIQEKLNLPNTAALIRYGLEQGLDKPR
jgi:DNA-binding NarL/FixJ family response regulator